MKVARLIGGWLRGMLVALTWLSPNAAGAQHARTSLEASLGVSMQTDVGEKRVAGIENFTLSPVGILMGVGVRHHNNETGAFGVTADVAFFPLLSLSTITAVSGAGFSPSVSSLVLGTVSLEWAPRDVAGGTAWPWFLSTGVTHAFDSPRPGTRNAFIGGLGILHHFKEHADLKGSVEFLAPSIGRTRLQIPLAVSVHR
ncbi:MAG: hypothetical protein ACM37U_05685 [Gemmatimonas sp.]